MLINAGYILLPKTKVKTTVYLILIVILMIAYIFSWGRLRVFRSQYLYPLAGRMPRLFPRPIIIILVVSFGDKQGT